MQIRWDDLGSSRADAADGQSVTLSGYPVTFPGQNRATRFLLTQEPGCCAGCAPRDPLGAIAIDALAPIPLHSRPLSLSGVWHIQPDTNSTYRLTDARPLDPPGWVSVTRRRILTTTGPLMCLGASLAPDGARAAIEATTTVDLHSHAGDIANSTRMRSGQAFGPVSVPMRAGGMAVVCLAVVSDGPTHKLMADGRLHPYRDPEPGELYTYSQLAFARLLGMAETQGLALVTNAARLQAARAGTASTIIAAEGADFLEGQPDRVDEAYQKWSAATSATHPLPGERTR